MKMTAKQLRAKIHRLRTIEKQLHFRLAGAIIRETEEARYHPLFAAIPEVPTIKGFFRKLAGL